MRPSRMAASTRSSSASRRSSSRRVDSTRPASQLSSSPRGGPRHSAIASSRRYAARAGSPSVEQLTGPVDEPLELPGVDLVRRQEQPVAQPGGLDRVGAEGLAQPDDQPWTTLVQVPGG